MFVRKARPAQALRKVTAHVCSRA